MYKNRLLIIVAGAMLIVAVILIANAVGPQVAAVSSQSPVGFGDLRSIEAQQSSSNSGALEAIDGKVGRNAGSRNAISSNIEAIDGRVGRNAGSRSAISSNTAFLTAESQRLTGLANQSVNMYGSTSRLNASSSALTQAQQAELARWKGLAGQNNNLYGSTSRLNASSPALTQSQQAEMARWNGLAAQAKAVTSLFGGSMGDLRQFELQQSLQQ